MKLQIFDPKKYCHRLPLHFVLVGCLLATSTGCFTTPVCPVAIQERFPEKDVVARLIKLRAPLSAERYNDYAQDHLNQYPPVMPAAVATVPATPSPVPAASAPPVYEVTYSFHNGREILATVQYRRESEIPGQQGNLNHMWTRVYREAP